jgi:hypothetical protein
LRENTFISLELSGWNKFLKAHKMTTRCTIPEPVGELSYWKHNNIPWWKLP